jgi:hypothetical protein
MWQQDSTYYPGKCVGYDAASGKHTIEYEDGSTEVLRLRREGGRANSASTIWRLREKRRRSSDGSGREGAELLQNKNRAFGETEDVHARKTSKHRRASCTKKDGNWRAQTYHTKEEAAEEAAEEQEQEQQEEQEQEQEQEEEEEEVAVTEVHSWSGMYPSVVVALGFRLQVSTPRGAGAEVVGDGGEGMGATLIRGQTSKYRGVCLNKSNSKWQAQIHHTGKQHRLGSFDDEEEAARAYDRAARAHRGDKATLNFPAEGEQGVNNGKRSKYRGVSWHKSNSKWLAYIKHTGKSQYLGSFDDEEEAARAYDTAARTHHGDKAILNFPVEGKQGLSVGVTSKYRGSKLLLKTKEEEEQEQQEEQELEQEQEQEQEEEVAATEVHSRSGMCPPVVVALGFRLQASTPRGAGTAVVGGGGKGREAKLICGQTSKYRGVSWDKSNSKWKAQINHTRKIHYLGTFDDEEEAARAYDRAVRAHRGDKATLNFPAEGEQGVSVGVSSKYRGVCWSKSSSKWVASIRHSGKLHWLGSFDDEEEAARAYDRAARAHHGEKAMPNFPAEGNAENEKEAEVEKLVMVVVEEEEEEQEEEASRRY